MYIRTPVDGVRPTSASGARKTQHRVRRLLQPNPTRTFGSQNNMPFILEPEKHKGPFTIKLYPFVFVAHTQTNTYAFTLCTHTLLKVNARECCVRIYYYYSCSSMRWYHAAHKRIEFKSERCRVFIIYEYVVNHSFRGGLHSNQHTFTYMWATPSSSSRAFGTHEKHIKFCHVRRK